ncbi:MAG: hypothetical protein AAF512_01565, partial [Pseudomonadota bacterium]
EICMPLGLATALLYLACVAFYHAHEKRSELSWVKTSSAFRFGMRISAWGLFLVSLYIIGQYLGWARGIPVWLGLLTLMGLSSILIAVLIPKYHVITGSISAGLALITGAVAAIS